MEDYPRNLTEFNNYFPTVEVDETYIGGKRSGKRGRGAAGKSLVLIAVEDKGCIRRPAAESNRRSHVKFRCSRSLFRIACNRRPMQIS